MGGLFGGGGGAKGMLAPTCKIIGGRGAGPLVPPLPTPMCYGRALSYREENGESQKLFLLSKIRKNMEVYDTSSHPLPPRQLTRLTTTNAFEINRQE